MRLNNFGHLHSPSIKSGIQFKRLPITSIQWTGNVPFDKEDAAWPCPVKWRQFGHTQITILTMKTIMINVKSSRTNNFIFLCVKLPYFFYPPFNCHNNWYLLQWAFYFRPQWLFLKSPLCNPRKSSLMIMIHDNNNILIQRPNRWVEYSLSE